jgi:hypothetical protein
MRNQTLYKQSTQSKKMSYSTPSRSSKKTAPRIAKLLAEHRAEKHDTDVKRHQANAALKAQAEEAKYSKPYPFQACAFAYIFSYFEPQLTEPSWQ